MQPVSLLVTEIQKQPRFSGEKNYIHAGHPLKKKKKKRYGEGGNVNSDISFSPPETLYLE